MCGDYLQLLECRSDSCVPGVHFPGDMRLKALLLIAGHKQSTANGAHLHVFRAIIRGGWNNPLRTLVQEFKESYVFEFLKFCLQKLDLISIDFGVGDSSFLAGSFSLKHEQTLRE